MTEVCDIIAVFIKKNSILAKKKKVIVQHFTFRLTFSFTLVRPAVAPAVQLH